MVRYGHMVWRGVDGVDGCLQVVIQLCSSVGYDTAALAVTDHPGLLEDDEDDNDDSSGQVIARQLTRHDLMDCTTFQTCDAALEGARRRTDSRTSCSQTCTCSWSRSRSRLDDRVQCAMVIAGAESVCVLLVLSSPAYALVAAPSHQHHAFTTACRVPVMDLDSCYDARG